MLHRNLSTFCCPSTLPTTRKSSRCQRHKSRVSSASVAVPLLRRVDEQILKFWSNPLENATYTEVVATQIFSIFIPTWGHDPIWRAYFSDVLVQPPTSIPSKFQDSLWKWMLGRCLFSFWDGNFSGDVFFTSSGFPKPLLKWFICFVWIFPALWDIYWLPILGGSPRPNRWDPSRVCLDPYWGSYMSNTFVFGLLWKTHNMRYVQLFQVLLCMQRISQNFKAQLERLNLFEVLWSRSWMINEV